MKYLLYIPIKHFSSIKTFITHIKNYMYLSSNRKLTAREKKDKRDNRSIKTNRANKLGRLCVKTYKSEITISVNQP